VINCRDLRDTTLVSAQGRRAEDFVDRASGGKRAGKDGCLAHRQAADGEVGLQLDQLSQFGDAGANTAHAANRQMNREAAVFLTVAEFGQGSLNAVVQGDHLLGTVVGAEPNGAWSSGVGKRAGAAQFEIERLDFGGPALDGPTVLGDLGFMDVAEELLREVEIVRLDPFHVGRGAGETRDQFFRPGADGPGDFDGDEGAKGLFHRD
jgi:hypothetical protein